MVEAFSIIRDEPIPFDDAISVFPSEYVKSVYFLFPLFLELLLFCFPLLLEEALPAAAAFWAAALGALLLLLRFFDCSDSFLLLLRLFG